MTTVHQGPNDLTFISLISRTMGNYKRRKKFLAFNFIHFLYLSVRYYVIFSVELVYSSLTRLCHEFRILSYRFNFALIFANKSEKL